MLPYKSFAKLIQNGKYMLSAPMNLLPVYLYAGMHKVFIGIPLMEYYEIHGPDRVAGTPGCSATI